MPNNSPFNNNLVVLDNKIKMIALQKQPIFLLNGEVIWQVSDSPLSKELHGIGNADVITVRTFCELSSRISCNSKCRQPTTTSTLSNVKVKFSF